LNSLRRRRKERGSSARGKRRDEWKGGERRDEPLEVRRSALAVSNELILTLDALSDVAVSISDSTMVLDLKEGGGKDQLGARRDEGRELKVSNSLVDRTDTSHLEIDSATKARNRRGWDR